MKFHKGIKIDGVFFDIPMVSLKRNADFLHKYAERNEEGELLAEMIGVYYNYTLTAGTSSDFGDTEIGIRCLLGQDDGAGGVPRHLDTYKAGVLYLQRIRVQRFRRIQEGSGQ